MNSYDSVQCALVNIPHLEHLDIYVHIKNRNSFATVLQLNRQLQRLTIRGIDSDLRLLRFISECTHLESLGLFGDYDCSDFARGVPINFKSVRKFETSGQYLQALGESNISITFEQFDELTLYGRWNNAIDHFMQIHPKTLTKLQCKTCILSSENVFNIIRKRHLLKYFEFKVYKHKYKINEYNILKDRLGAEWNLSIDEQHVVKLER